MDPLCTSGVKGAPSCARDKADGHRVPPPCQTLPECSVYINAFISPPDSRGSLLSQVRLGEGSHYSCFWWLSWDLNPGVHGVLDALSPLSILPEFPESRFCQGPRRGDLGRTSPATGCGEA